MRIDKEHRIACTPARFWELVFDPDFDRRQALEALQVERYELLERADDGHTLSLRTRIFPKSNMPGFVKRWVGEDLSYEACLRRELGSNEAQATMTMSVMPEKIALGYRMRVVPDGDDRCLRLMQWEVRIASLGGIFERFVLAQLTPAMDASARFFDATVAGPSAS